MVKDSSLSARRAAALRTAAILVAVLALALSGCALITLIMGDVRFNEIIEGEIDFGDEHDEDSNSLMFYWDWYDMTLSKDKSYTLELWTDPDEPIHFKCKALGVDIGCWSDGDKTWDGYLLYEFPASASGKIGFDFYLRADKIDDDSWYKFRVNED